MVFSSMECAFGMVLDIGVRSVFLLVRESSVFIEAAVGIVWEYYRVGCGGKLV